MAATTSSSMSAAVWFRLQREEDGDGVQLDETAVEPGILIRAVECDGDQIVND